MTNRRLPSRQLAPLRMAGNNRLSQLEAVSVLEVLERANEAMSRRFGDTQKYRARLRAIDKLKRSLAMAERLSIPKGLKERPNYLPTIYSED